MYRGNLCDFFHSNLTPKNTNTSDNNKDETKEYKCVGCETNWTAKTCVVVQRQSIYFRLNCEDWVKHKYKVLDKCWTHFDNYGYQR